MEEYEFLKQLVKRPGMYVGANRLDLLRSFLDGFYAYKRLNEPSLHMPPVDYELQRWLLMKESASIAHAASINAWDLLMRCYGNGKEACEAFRLFFEELGEASWEPWKNGRTGGVGDTAAMHIWQIYSHYHWGSDGQEEEFSRETRGDYYPLKQELKTIFDPAELSYEGLVSFAERMIPEPHGDIRICVQYESYFQQIRFLYETEQGEWKDQNALSGRASGKAYNNETYDVKAYDDEMCDVEAYDAYYKDLVILHAAAALARREEHSHHRLSIHRLKDRTYIECEAFEDVWYAIYNCGADKSAGSCHNPLNMQFSRWKESVLGR